MLFGLQEESWTEQLFLRSRGDISDGPLSQCSGGPSRSIVEVRNQYI